MILLQGNTRKSGERKEMGEERGERSERERAKERKRVRLCVWQVSVTGVRGERREERGERREERREKREEKTEKREERREKREDGKVREKRRARYRIGERRTRQESETPVTLVTRAKREERQERGERKEERGDHSQGERPLSSGISCSCLLAISTTAPSYCPLRHSRTDRRMSGFVLTRERKVFDGS